MAKKSELLEQAAKLNLELTEKNTIAEIEAAIEDAEKTASEVSDEEQSEEPKLAKAGKRSAKAIKEAEAKAEKEEHKEKLASGEIQEENTKRGPKPVTRSKLERRSKKYKEVYKLIEVDKTYTVSEAVELLPKLNIAKFEGSAELHIKLGVDPKHADQNIRGTVILPHGTGKTKTVAVFAPADMHKAAKDAGADIVGEETLLEQLDKEIVNFEVLISTPQLMAKLSKYARLLGPKGLMPNPKTGTVAVDVAKAVSEAKAGKVEYRVDKQGIIHLGVGKLNFKASQLAENIDIVLRAIREAKPASVKGEYIQNITLAPTMGPGLKVDKV
ncbi:MAG: ribosomal protein [Patescibacteria group bacterium]|nr:ribosomal protein [Patescibacteria group bacterium]